ncbi:MAG: hypothetical protein A3I66_21070 [Burkholderiales bacterium RIFCSPLOWO2_02_FULL_57_36]|nr:MAG: hypothetical protein A3I66_21070 [Burkholderiales bacterium RIFCSPLOWO2_02_FULL_57_36]
MAGVLPQTPSCRAPHVSCNRRNSALNGGFDGSRVDDRLKILAEEIISRRIARLSYLLLNKERVRGPAFTQAQSPLLTAV